MTSAFVHESKARLTTDIAQSGVSIDHLIATREHPFHLPGRD
jgi:hypothetical protein